MASQKDCADVTYEGLIYEHESGEESCHPEVAVHLAQRPGETTKQFQSRSQRVSRDIVSV